MSDRRTRIEEATFIIRSAGGTIVSPIMFNPIRFKVGSDTSLPTRLASRLGATVSSEAENNIMVVLV
jgi:hypothetical protein